MQQKRNYQKDMEQIIAGFREAGAVPSLFLHSCCAPCSSYVLEYLSQYFRITDFYYNPNITDREEYRKRTEELKRLIASQPHAYPVTFVEGSYEPERFLAAVRGYEDCREGGKRCEKCFRLRLFESARLAAEGGFDFFTTSLTISPLKNAALLNAVGQEAGEKYGVSWLPSDFKKRGGYQRSIELSGKYGLYRQNFCGCEFSKREAAARNEK